MSETKKRSVNLYEIVYVAVLVVLLVFGMFFLGRPKTGVLDVGRVVSGLGMDVRMDEDSKEWEESAGAELKKLEDDFAQQTGDIQARIDAATGADREKLRQELKDTNRAFVRESSAVRGRVRAHQREVVGTFRARLQPFINNVAEKKRLRLVFERSGSRVLYSVSGIDITEAVIEEARPAFEQEMALLEMDDDDADADAEVSE